MGIHDIVDSLGLLLIELVPDGVEAHFFRVIGIRWGIFG